MFRVVLTDPTGAVLACAVEVVAREIAAVAATAELAIFAKILDRVAAGAVAAAKILRGSLTAVGTGWVDALELIGIDRASEAVGLVDELAVRLDCLRAVATASQKAVMVLDVRRSALALPTQAALITMSVVPLPGWKVLLRLAAASAATKSPLAVARRTVAVAIADASRLIDPARSSEATGWVAATNDRVAVKTCEMVASGPVDAFICLAAALIVTAIPGALALRMIDVWVVIAAAGEVEAERTAAVARVEAATG